MTGAEQTIGDAGGVVEAFTIHDARRPPGLGMLDPITVVLIDDEGHGLVLISCFGASWSCWFGSTGCNSLRAFLTTVDADYLAGKLVTCTLRRSTKKEEIYVRDIAQAVITACRSGKKFGVDIVGSVPHTVEPAPAPKPAPRPAPASSGFEDMDDDIPF